MVEKTYINPTTTSTSDQVYGMPKTNPKGYEIPLPTKTQPNIVKVEKVYIEEITNKPHEFTPKGLLDMSQDEYLGSVVEAMLNFDPNLYMLKLTHASTKILMDFDVNQLRYTTFLGFGARNNPSQIQPLVHNIIE